MTKETKEDMAYSHTSGEKGTNYSLQYISSYQMLKKTFSFKPTSVRKYPKDFYWLYAYVYNIMLNI